MFDTYKIIENLCDDKGITVTQMCRDTEIPRANLSEFKAGRKKTLGAPILSKIADYFGVTVDYLLGKEERPEPKVTDRDIKFALFGGDAEKITEAQFEEVKRFAQFIKERDKK